MPSTNYPQKAIREKNDTVLKYGIDEITDEFDKTRTHADKTALDAKDIIGLGTTNGFVKMASDMFRLVELDMVSVIMWYSMSSLKSILKYIWCSQTFYPRE